MMDKVTENTGSGSKACLAWDSPETLVVRQVVNA